MNISKLNQFGTDLAGREFGKKVYELIIKETEHPIILDFGGVGSMGSSFADEVVVKIARMQDNKVIVRNPNRVVRSCLSDVVEETRIDAIIQEM